MNESRIGTKEAARILGVSERRVLQLANEGKIAHERTVLGRLYDAADVERLARERANPAGAAA